MDPAQTGTPADAEEARRRYRRHARTYDRRIRVLAPVRSRVIERLGLTAGGHALDLGCGTGASFANLLRAVGDSGWVTGVELSEEMAAVARARIDEAGWRNVEVVVGDARRAALPDNVDAALFFLTHDLVRTPEVLRRAVAAIRPGGRVVSFGPVLADHCLRAPVNAAVRRIARPYVTTLEGLDQPWSHLARLVPDLQVHRLALDGAYVAVGHVDRRDRSCRQRESGDPGRDA